MPVQTLKILHGFMLVLMLKAEAANADRLHGARAYAECLRLHDWQDRNNKRMPQNSGTIMTLERHRLVRQDFFFVFARQWGDEFRAALGSTLGGAEG